MSLIFLPLFVLYNNETTTRDKAFFYSKSFQHNAKAGLCLAFARFGEHEKSRLTWAIMYTNEAIPLVVMRNKELWLVQENHVTTKPASSSSCSSVAPRGTKTYSESRIELRNLQILKKMQANRQFLSSEQPSEMKCLDVALNIAGVEKYARETCGCSQQWRSFNSSFLNERNVSDGGNLCPVVGDSKITLI